MRFAAPLAYGWVSPPERAVIGCTGRLTRPQAGFSDRRCSVVLVRSTEGGQGGQRLSTRADLRDHDPHRLELGSDLHPRHLESAYGFCADPPGMGIKAGLGEGGFGRPPVLRLGPGA